VLATLAIETSVPLASISLLTSDGNVITRKFQSHRAQNQLLFPPLVELLDLLPPDHRLDLIIVGTGPGSYSGSRIAIAAAQGIGITHKCPVVGLSSLLATPFTAHNQPATAVGDARRGSYFTIEIPTKSLPKEPNLTDLETFHKILPTLQTPIITFEQDLPNPTAAEIHLTNPSSELLIQAHQNLPQAQKQHLLITPPAPAYLRAPFISKAKPGHPLLRKKSSPQS